VETRSRDGEVQWKEIEKVPLVADEIMALAFTGFIQIEPFWILINTALLRIHKSDLFDLVQ